MTLELTNVYSNGDEGSARSFNNPMHTESKGDDIESCNPIYTECIDGTERKRRGARYHGKCGSDIVITDQAPST